MSRSPLVCVLYAVLCSFYPEVLLVCGSPIGLFLSIRQASGKNLFKFKTTNRFFNLFHVRRRGTHTHSCKPMHA